MKILIVGGAGMVGQKLVARLAQDHTEALGQHVPVLWLAFVEIVLLSEVLANEQHPSGGCVG